MLRFRQVGTQAFEQYITHHLLNQPSSTNAPVRQCKLLTMAPVKRSKRRLSQKEKELRQVTKCLRRRLAWCNHTKLPFDASLEQYSILPRALADEEGNPHKSAKSSWTDKLQACYQTAQPPVVVSTLPQGWLPQVVIIDSMFLINTKPLRQTKTPANYARLIFDRFALQHLKAGASEVHFVFDNPGQQPFNPKQFEHGRRDCTQKTTSHHQHISFTPETALPQAWPEYIGCRLCKCSIVEGIGLTFFKQGSYMVRPGKSWSWQDAFQAAVAKESAVLG